MVIFAWLFVLHFVADFLLQSREMGKKKSESFKWLMAHLAIQYFVIMLGMFPLILYMMCHAIDVSMFSVYATPFWMIAAFRCGFLSMLNALIHGLIDWNIWSLYKYSAYLRIKRNPDHPLLVDKANPMSWKFWEDHLFYSTIGFDQLLHGLTLLVIGVLFWS